MAGANVVTEVRQIKIIFVGGNRFIGGCMTRLVAPTKGTICQDLTEPAQAPIEIPRCGPGRSRYTRI